MSTCLGSLRYDVDILDDAMLRVLYLRVMKAREAMRARGGAAQDLEREREVVARLWDRLMSEGYGYELKREDLAAVWEAIFGVVRGPGATGEPEGVLQLTAPEPDAAPEPEPGEAEPVNELELDDAQLAEVEESLAEEDEASGVRVKGKATTDPDQMTLGADWGIIEKPPYRVPTVEEIKARPKHGLTLVSTFSGCGGSSLGFRMDGWNVLYASEFIEAARDSYLANFPDTFVDPRDIRDVTAESILARIGIGVGEVDVLEGSPPCSAFSTAGKREEGWGKVKKYSDSEQRVDDLFFEFARIVEGVQPKVFVAENVPGLLIGGARSIMHQIMARMRDAGYVVTGRVLNAADFGVPQRRRRLIFMGVRRDLADGGMRPAFPRAFGYQYVMKDAIPALMRAHHDTSGAWGVGDYTDAPSPTITVGINSLNSVHYKTDAPIILPPPLPEDVEEEVLPCSIEGYAIGREWEKLRPGEQSDVYFSLVRPAFEEPYPTVTQTGGNIGAASVVHPHEMRKFTIPELRRICGFPDDFRLTGSYRQRWERLGRAVPPLLMRAVAEAIGTQVICAG